MVCMHSLCPVRQRMVAGTHYITLQSIILLHITLKTNDTLSSVYSGLGNLCTRQSYLEMVEFWLSPTASLCGLKDCTMLGTLKRIGKVCSDVLYMSDFLKCAAEVGAMQLSRRLGRGWEHPKSLREKIFELIIFRKAAAHGHLSFVPSKLWVESLKVLCVLRLLQ